MRARNIKPSLYTNELLAVEDPLYTVIFTGLWCAADREGRMEDRPAKLHMAINPGRGYESTVRSLAWLTDNGFIQRYTLGGQRYIQVLMFWKHQNPHFKEVASVIPKAPGYTPIDEGKAPGSTAMDDGSTGDASDQNPGPASVLPPIDEGQTRLIPDSGFLIPDSGFLIPDSPSLPRVNGGGGVESEIRLRIDGIKAIYPVAARQDWITAEKLIRNLVTAGTSWAVILAGVQRYAKLCEATNRRPQNPGLWFGAIDQPWLQDWPLPTDTAAKPHRRRKTTAELEAEELARNAQH